MTKVHAYSASTTEICGRDMPIFEYKCAECGNTQDNIVKYDERKSSRQCVKCTDTALTALFVDRIHNSDFALKGKGWYKDGY